MHMPAQTQLEMWTSERGWELSPLREEKHSLKQRLRLHCSNSLLKSYSELINKEFYIFVIFFHSVWWNLVGRSAVRCSNLMSGIVWDCLTCTAVFSNHQKVNKMIKFTFDEFLPKYMRLCPRVQGKIEWEPKFILVQKLLKRHTWEQSSKSSWKMNTWKWDAWISTFLFAPKQMHLNSIFHEHFEISAWVQSRPKTSGRKSPVAARLPDSFHITNTDLYKLHNRV